MEAQQERPLPRSWMTPFFLIWTGQTFSLLGSRLAQFALIWWLTDTTGSATVLTSATLVALLPGVLLGPLVGALVDRWTRRIVMIAADAFIALGAVWLVYLFWSGTMQVWHVYVIVLIRAIGESFHWPAMMASTSLMVPKQHLARVQGLNQVVIGALNVAGPPLGALLYGLLSLYQIMAIDVLTALLAILPLLFVQIPEPQRRPSTGVENKPSLLKEAGEGLRYIWGWPGAVVLLVMAMLINFLLVPAFSLLPIVVKSHFGGQVQELGWIEATSGVGMVLGGLILGVWGGFRRRILTTFVGLIGMGVGAMALGLAPASALWLGVAGIGLVGLMNPITNGPILAALQSAVAPEMQGRVFTVVQSLSSLVSPLGLAVAGPVADALGVQVWYVVGGGVCALMGAVSFFVPSLVHLEDGHREPHPADPRV